MGFDPNYNRRAVALAGYRSRQFAGYAVKTGQGWICIVSVGMSWSRCPCRSVEEARMCLRSMSHAMDIQAFMSVDELNTVVKKLPEHLLPSITPDMLLEQYGECRPMALAAGGDHRIG